MKRDIFISYRRDGGIELAQMLYSQLTHDGYKVFFDIDSMRSGLFNEQIYKQIDASTCIILILPAHGLDRCEEEEDWVRKEISYGIEHKKKIIPVMMRGFEFPKNLPVGLKDLPNYQAINANMEFFDAWYARLKKYIDVIPRTKKNMIYIAFVLLIVSAISFVIIHTMGHAYQVAIDDREISKGLEYYITPNSSIQIKNHGIRTKDFYYLFRKMDSIEDSEWSFLPNVASLSSIPLPNDLSIGERIELCVTDDKSLIDSGYSSYIINVREDLECTVDVTVLFNGQKIKAGSTIKVKSGDELRIEASSDTGIWCIGTKYKNNGVASEIADVYQDSCIFICPEFDSGTTVELYVEAIANGDISGSNMTTKSGWLLYYLSY